MGHLRSKEAPSRTPPACAVNGARRGLPGRARGSGWSPSYRKSYLSALRSSTTTSRPTTNCRTSTRPSRVGATGDRANAATRRARTTSRSCSRRRALPARCSWCTGCSTRRRGGNLRRCPLARHQSRRRRVGSGRQERQGGHLPACAAAIRAFRVYRRWQLSEAEHRPAMRDALSDPETAYVLMTRNGNRSSPRRSPRWRPGTASVRASA